MLNHFKTNIYLLVMSIYDGIKDINVVVECVTELNENNLCALCDKPEFRRMRFSCGHSACENCVSASVGCYICSPPESFSSSKPIYDAVLTQQVKNVSQLCDTFQKVFNIDVDKRKRRSEQLKIEKELFPQCIQAPLKYYNKRKSFNKSYTGKENRRSHFPGEIISPVKKANMDNSINYVQNWLNKNDKNLKRKPLVDINQDNDYIKGHQNKLKRKIVPPTVKRYENKQRKSRKRSLKSVNSLVENQNTIETFIVPKKSKKISKDILKANAQPPKPSIKKMDLTQETEESGILIDDSSSSVYTEDIQLSDGYGASLLSSTVDKDKNALFEVIKAAQKEDYSPIENIKITSEIKANQMTENEMTNKLRQQYKVAFYRRSYLYKSCNLCSSNIAIYNNDKNESKDLVNQAYITISNSRLTTTIKMNNLNIVLRKNFDDKKSMAVQTDSYDICHIDSISEEILDMDTIKNINSLNKNMTEKKIFDLQSQYLFTVDENVKEVPDDNVNAFNQLNIKLQKSTNVRIEESDSSEDFDDSKVLEVTADVHRSGDHLVYDVLTQVENIEEHELRPRPGPRGQTPDSSNSSDKENFDPNRRKKINNSKKSCHKK